MKIDFDDISYKVTLLQKEAAAIHINPENFGITKDIISKEPMVKGGKNDYTTRVDQEIESRLKPVLLAMVDNSGFLGEETSSSGMNNRYRWVMDPTDGTAVYSLGGEYYSNSLALIDRYENEGKGDIIFGSVYQSATGRQFLMINQKLVVRELVQIDNVSSIIQRTPCLL